MKDTLIRFTSTLGSAAVVAALAMIYYNIKARSELHKNHKIIHAILTGFIFGLFSIYCSISAVEVNGTFCNCRDLPPLYAGMVAGPIAGIIAGVIGAAYRYFVGGGVAAVPCAISCLLASVIGSVAHIIIKKYYKYTILVGVICAVISSSAHMIIAAAFGLGEMTTSNGIPMLFATTAGMAFCMYMYKRCHPTLEQ